MVSFEEKEGGEEEKVELTSDTSGEVERSS